MPLWGPQLKSTLASAPARTLYHMVELHITLLPHPRRQPTYYCYAQCDAEIHFIRSILFSIGLHYSGMVCDRSSTQPTLANIQFHIKTKQYLNYLRCCIVRREWMSGDFDVQCVLLVTSRLLRLIRDLHLYLVGSDDVPFNASMVLAFHTSSACVYVRV